MYHVQARNKSRYPDVEFKNVTLVAIPWEAAKARMARLKFADPSREYRVVREVFAEVPPQSSEGDSHD